MCTGVDMHAGFALALVVSMLGQSPSTSDDLFAKKVEALAGLSSIGVVVEKIPDVEGLEEKLRTLVELRLRQNGIQVNALAAAHIYLNANVIRLSDKRHMIYNIRIELNRYVDVYIIPEKKNKLMMATVWLRSVVGITPLTDEQPIKEGASDLLDEFLNIYLQANPSRR
jgi:hypothetical protein